MTKSIFNRFSEISRGENNDSSDEYYTLFHAFADALLEVICRHQKGKTYKIIICPCDSKTSVFRELEKYKDMIGNPRIVYSFWPQKDWKEYFSMDFKKEYGCSCEDVLIFTNPPFKGLSENMRMIGCDFVLFGSNAVSIRRGIYAKETGGFIYIKNIYDFDGNADNFKQNYGAVSTVFYSNSEFLSEGRVYTNISDKGTSILFGKDKLKLVKN